MEVGSAYVTLMPSMKGFASKVNSEFGSAGTASGSAFSKGFSSSTSSLASAGSKAGESFTTAFSNATKKDVVSGLTSQVEKAAANLKSANVAAQAASKGAESAQAKYNETVAKYGTESSKAIKAEQQLIQA